MQEMLSVDAEEIGTIIPKLQADSNCNIILNGKTAVISTPSKEAMQIIKRRLSSILSQLIIEKYESKHIGRIIDNYYFYFSDKEKQDIFDKARTLLWDNLTETRLKVVEERLNEYLDEADMLVVDGFINFRLREYKRDLTMLVDKAVDQFQASKEYDEFIGLLRYFVDVQRPQELLIHVIRNMDGSYNLYNYQYTELTHQRYEDFLDDADRDMLTFDDVLITSLITLAPRKIVVHRWDSTKSVELWTTLNQIFQGRIEVCNGCGKCR